MCMMNFFYCWRTEDSGAALCEAVKCQQFYIPISLFWLVFYTSTLLSPFTPSTCLLSIRSSLLDEGSLHITLSVPLPMAITVSAKPCYTNMFIFVEPPIPLAGQFVLPPLMTGTAGHAWMLLDEYCHLQYQIVVTGLERTDDAALSAHLHSTQKHKRLLKGFYGSQVSGVQWDWRSVSEVTW